MRLVYLYVEGNQMGPYEPGKLRQLLAQGKVTTETPAWHEGLKEWSTLGAVLPPAPPRAPRVPRRSSRSKSSADPNSDEDPTAKKGLSGCIWAAIIVVAALVGLIVLSCLAGIALGPIKAGIRKAKEAQAMQSARTIGLAMTAYSYDHKGAYPDGSTSTEVFQKLLDGKYVRDPGIFYLSMPGKTKATSNVLTADNVSFDCTSGVMADSSAAVPLVFCTGYSVAYAPDASALRDQSSPTPFATPGLAVSYKDNSALFLHGDVDGVVPNFIPSSFFSGLQSYHQLKP